MTKMMKTPVLLLAALLVCLAACQRGKFHVSGHVTDAADTTLYFEALGLDGVQLLDSARLDAAGTFSFSGDAAKNPEFYRLRIGDNIINLSVDSTESIGVEATLKDMPTGYTVKGSDNCQKMKELAALQMKLQEEIMSIGQNVAWTDEQKDEYMRRSIAAYKTKVKREYIFKTPAKAYAYFAVFQTLGSYLIFDPQNDPDDVKTYAAVATAWDTYYPSTPRTENLHNIVIEGMKQTRRTQLAENERQQAAANAKPVEVLGVIPISLPDIKGVIRNLTDLKGKVVLLDFTLYGAKGSPERILQLRELYNKYAVRGFEIYQVGYDSNEHFWKTSCQNLPWICVYDAEGISSRNLSQYRVEALPEFFLINKDNELVARSSNIGNLEQEIEKLVH